MNELALFAGGGGGLLASRLLGWSTVAACEIDPYARAVLLRRQSEGHLESFPIWDDVRTFDGRPWRGLIDVISGGFPCQDISAAGKGAGLAGARSGLWFEYLRIIDEVRPRYVFAENSPLLRTRGLGTIIEGLTGLGYDVRWGVLGAAHVGAPHIRKRMWVVAHAHEIGRRGRAAQDAEGGSQPGQALRPAIRRENVSHPHGTGLEGRDGGGVSERAGELPARSAGPRDPAPPQRPTWWDAEPRLGRVAYGVADRVDRLRCIGNGQVPAVACLAWEVLSAGFAKGGLTWRGRGEHCQ